jgi:hypothetical protein
MRVGTFRETTSKLLRERRDEDMCYQAILENPQTAAKQLVERLQLAYPQFQDLHLAVCTWNGFIVVEDKRTQLVHFAYHPTLYKPTVWWYNKAKRRAVKKEWRFWDTPQLSDPSELLSRDVLMYVLSFCGVRDVLRMRSMNRAWRSAADTPMLWTLRFARMNVYDQTPSAQAFADYFLGDFETDEQLLVVGRAWLHSVGQSRAHALLYTGGKARVHLKNAAETPKMVLRWVGTGSDGTGVIVWITLGKLHVLSPKSKDGYHTMPTKRWLLMHVLKYCDDVYEGKILLQ